MQRTVWLVALGLSIGAVGRTGAEESLPAVPAAATPSIETPAQQLSYCLGLNFGLSLTQDGVEVDQVAMMTGIVDGLRGAKPQLTDEQIAAVMKDFEAQMRQRAEAQQAQMGDIAKANQVRGEAFVAKFDQQPGVQKTASGLRYRVVKQGAGATPTKADVVSCHYEGKFVNGEVFDSSYQRGEPTEFPVGRVIPGWTEALQLMKTGDVWELVIPSELAYGPDGYPPVIGPAETLVFKIELLEVK